MLKIVEPVAVGDLVRVDDIPVGSVFAYMDGGEPIYWYLKTHAAPRTGQLRVEPYNAVSLSEARIVWFGEDTRPNYRVFNATLTLT
jgi:hypothetical protein